MAQECPHCKGTGKCSSCGGVGKSATIKVGGVPANCGKCRNGSGKCTACNGLGKK